MADLPKERQDVYTGVMSRIGELATWASGFDLWGVSIKPALLLFSLGTALLSLIFAVSLVPVVSLLTSPFSSTVVFLGERQVGTDQLMPVKLLSWNPFFSHLRQGFPDRSRARRPALMAPWLALGPSFWVEDGITPLGVLSPFSPL